MIHFEKSIFFGSTNHVLVRSVEVFIDENFRCELSHDDVNSHYTRTACKVICKVILSTTSKGTED